MLLSTIKQLSAVLLLMLCSSCCFHPTTMPSFKPDTLESLSLEELLAVRLPGKYKGRGIYQSPQNPISENTVNFAVMMPLGFFPKYSTSMFAAADLAAERLNRSGGINGRPVAIIRADINHSRESAVNFAAQLVRDYKAVALFGPNSTEEVREVMTNVTIPLKLPLVTTAASSTSLSNSDLDVLFWQLAANNQQQAGAIVDFLKKKGSYKRVALISGKGIYGKEMSYSIRNKLADSQFFELSYSSLVRMDLINLNSDFQKLKEFKADAIVFTIHSNIISSYLTKLDQYWKEELPTLIAGDVLVKAPADQKPPFPRVASCLNLIVTGSSLPSDFEQAMKQKLDYPDFEHETASLYDSIILMALALEKKINSGKSMHDIMQNITSGEVRFDGLNLSDSRIINKNLDSFKYFGASGPVKFIKNGTNEFAKVRVEKYVSEKQVKCQ